MRSFVWASAGLLSMMGCGGQATPQKAEAPRPYTLACPTIGEGQPNYAQLFGVDARLSARLARTMRLAQALERTVKELDEQARSACQTLVLDLQSTVAVGEHACAALGRRVRELKAALGSGGFHAQVSGLSCSVPADALATCAGQCLTGQPDVVSSVSCAAGSASGCGLDFALPNASRECAAECGVSSLSRAVCTATVDVRIGTGAVSTPEYAAMAEALRRDLPRLYGIAQSLAPRGAALATDSVQLVDDLAASIDELSSGKDSLDRGAVAGLVLGGCIAPKLVQIVRDSDKLRAALALTTEARASFDAP